MFIVAGLSALAAIATAFSGDPQVLIDRAIDSPTLTVRYNGVSASLIELRINGASLGTRTVSSAKQSGETNFTLNVTDLKEGENDVEVCLYDRTGKLVKTEHTNIQTAPVQQGPISFSDLKMGQTVHGPVTLNLSFNQKISDPYVSFFVDGNFKAMMNVPPFVYHWDSEREANGWHELEAWAIDSSNTTHKTGKLRLFVDNSHGDTLRPGVKAGLETTDPSDVTVSTPAGTKMVKPSTRGITSTAIPALPSVTVSNPVGTKPPHINRGLATGPYSLNPKVPNPIRVASNLKPGNHSDMVVSITRSNPGHVLHEVADAASLVSLTKGSRIPNIGSFEIALDGDFVDFHGVMPRVDEGVPMTPIRFLLEQAGGKVDWENYTKTVNAKTTAHNISLRIGDLNAMVNNLSISLERAPYIDRGRTIVPLSFIQNTLDVHVQYDKNTGHVLVTSDKQ